MHLDSRPTLAAPDDDPHLWLEEVDGERAISWVGKQNAATLARFGGERLNEDAATLKAIFDRPDRIPLIGRRGGLVYNYWIDAANPKGLWRRTTLPDYRTGAPTWETLLDLDALSAAEGEDWIWRGPTTLPPSHHRAILALSRGGADAVALREFDLERKTFVADGFQLPEAKGGAAWLDRDTLLLSSTFGENQATNSGYARRVRVWKRGADVADAPVMFEGRVDSISVSGNLELTGRRRLTFVSESLDFFRTERWIGEPDGPLRKFELPEDAGFDLHRDVLLVGLRTPWEVGGRVHPSDALIAIPLDEFLGGGRDFTVLFEPGPRRVIEGYSWSGDQLTLVVQDDLRPVCERLTLVGREWRRMPIEGLPHDGVVSIWPLDGDSREGDGTMATMFEDPLTPPTFALLEPGAAPAVLRRGPELFRTDGLVVERHEAVSVDGERIPYFQVGPKGAHGDAPVHLSGYGGFEISSKPHYDPGIGKLWLERGGVSVVANIRGGGEFGTRWHDAGRLANKARSHDDFASVAADLVARGVTKPERIAAEGGSNGGLLIANMLTRYPERFGALFCTIPLIDMRRYTKLLAGASWMAEYGDPEKAEDWAFIQTFSAYHAAEPGRRYPPILLATSRKDDRVHPGHARKMAAKLQAMGCDASFYEPAAGGHGYGKDNSERASFMALGLEFLRQNIGWK